MGWMEPNLALISHQILHFSMDHFCPIWNLFIIQSLTFTTMFSPLITNDRYFMDTFIPFTFLPIFITMEFHNEESCIVDGAVVSSGHSTTTFLSRKVLDSNPKALHVYNNAPSHKFNKIFSSRTMKKNIKDQKNIS